MGIFFRVKKHLPSPIGTMVLRSLSRMPLDKKVKWGLFDRPNYAYGLYHSALLAQRLGLERISSIEFGVAGGNGLVAMEQIAEEINRSGLGVQIQVIGFDTGEGMPESKDPRDLPYVWKPGYFKMDVPALQARLKSAKLVLGNVERTISGFAEQFNSAPIGFISFDLDYYSSTKTAFRIFESSVENFLPRVLCYFDDCVGDDWELHSEFSGELLAIREFNEANMKRKIAPIYGFQYKRILKEQWNSEMFAAHLFDHPKYCQHIYPNSDWQKPVD